MVGIDGYDYRDNCRLNDDQKDQMFFWLSKCSVIMQRHAPLLRKYDMYDTDGHIFGKTFSGKEMKHPRNCVNFAKYHKYEI